jgi:hypothetical protein
MTVNVYVILRSEATKNPVSGKQATSHVKNETLRFAQGDIDKCDFYPNAIQHKRQTKGSHEQATDH